LERLRLAWHLLNVHSIRCMKTKLSSRASSGFTLIELMIVVALIGLLTTLAMPNLAKARDTSRLNMIYSNLRALDAAKDQWALDNNQASGTPVTDITVLSKYFRWGNLRDVINETYVPNPVGTPSEADLPAGVRLGTFGPGAAIPAP
jgi:prepilin-type N-terminal cleavage/methylation domain-containing protein